MGEILKFKRPSTAEKFKGSSLCRDGFHKWKIRKEKQFDVKQGKLVTLYECIRCGKQKVETH
jgi:hypothetical protein